MPKQKPVHIKEGDGVKIRSFYSDNSWYEMKLDYREAGELIDNIENRIALEERIKKRLGP